MPLPRQLATLALAASLMLVLVGCIALLSAGSATQPAGKQILPVLDSPSPSQAGTAPAPADSELAPARDLLTAAATKRDGWEAAATAIEVDAAPDGLGDLVALRRAEAALNAGNVESARNELERPEVRGSTNRPILEQAGKLAERAGAPALAGDLYARGAGYFGWTAERVRMYLAAGAAYGLAGMAAQAADQYRTVVENYTWTKSADLAGEKLESMDALPTFHRGILEISQGERDAGMASLAEAAEGGPYASAAAARLKLMGDAIAWAEAVDIGMTAAYRAYRAEHPDGAYVEKSRFQEGFAYYEADRLSEALTVWDDAASRADGDGRARALLWASKALEALGDTEQAAERLKNASEVKPGGYYAVRALDLLAGKSGWARASGIPEAGSADEAGDVDRWINEWAAASQPDAGLELRAKRGLGLAALGLPLEAEAELNAAVADSDDPRFLFRLALTLADRELWPPASRAAGKVAGLSPAKSSADVPPGLQRLIYPAAYRTLVTEESERKALDPVLLLSIVYQESRYDRFALSYADARGLTQVMPATGKAMAPALEMRDFTADDLYQPDVALRLGAYYLDEQMETFEGDTFRALAAYNAGPGPLSRWSSTPDPDLFVERIDYSQTRDYVRQIYYHYSIYRALLGDP